MLNKTLVLLSYGRVSEYNRAIFSVLSFYSWVDDLEQRKIRIVVYTDQPSFFENYLSHIDIEYILLTPELLQGMLGGTDFIHRRKIGVIDITFQKYPGNHILFIDSDTFFIKNPRKILNGFLSGKSLMHKKEYTFKEGLRLYKEFNQAEYPEAFLEYISNRNFVINGTVEQFSENDYSWNAGVLGLNADFFSYMPDVFKLNDQFYSNSRWFVSEQLAFALILQKKTNIVSAEEFILHYWGKRQKNLMDRFLSRMINVSAANLRQKRAVKSLTRKLKRKVETDLVLEQAVIAISHKNWNYGLKKSIQAILYNPLSLSCYKELFSAVLTGG